MKGSWLLCLAVLAIVVHGQPAECPLRASDAQKANFSKAVAPCRALVSADYMSDELCEACDCELMRVLYGSSPEDSLFLKSYGGCGNISILLSDGWYNQLLDSCDSNFWSVFNNRMAESGVPEEAFVALSECPTATACRQEAFMNMYKQCPREENCSATAGDAFALDYSAAVQPCQELIDADTRDPQLCQACECAIWKARIGNSPADSFWLKILGGCENVDQNLDFMKSSCRGALFADLLSQQYAEVPDDVWKSLDTCEHDVSCIHKYLDAVLEQC